MGDTYKTGDRRPIASREWKVSRAVARWLVERGISPDGISVAGMIAGLAAGACLVGTAQAGRSERILWVAGAVLIQLRLLANMFDGMVAIEAKRASPVGELFNEAPDRVSDSAVLLGLGFAANGSALLGLTAALTAMFTAYVRAIGKVAGAAQEFCGPMAKQQRMFLVTAVALFCAVAPQRWRFVSGVSIVQLALVVIILGCIWTALRRLRRAGKASAGKNTMTARDRLFGYEHAFDHPVARWITVAVVVVLAVAWIAIWVLARFGIVGASLAAELRQRTLSWIIMAPLMIGPLLLGAFWTMLAVGLLSIACYREYTRATGLFREKTISFVVVLGIFAVTLAALDHWYGFFVALFPLTVAAITTSAILADQPRGYIQRVGLGVFGFMLFGCAFGHLGYFANDASYRPMLLLLLLTVELNDVFAFICGKSFGRRKFAPNTSPNKTLGGALGALILTTAVVMWLGRFVFAGTVLAEWPVLLGLGIIISAVGQLGDLTLSSIKRDLGIKDISNLIPGHGGLLDRFNSMMFVAPAVFHYVGYFKGIGLDQTPRILTGG